MTTKLWLLFFLLPTLAFGRVASVRLDTSSVNLTTTYTLVALPTSFVAIDTLLINNRSSTEIAITCSTLAGHAPDDATTAVIYVDATEKWALPDKAGFASTCYWKSMSGTISSGVITLTAIGR